MTGAAPFKATCRQNKYVAKKRGMIHRRVDCDEEFTDAQEMANHLFNEHGVTGFVWRPKRASIIKHQPPRRSITEKHKMAELLAKYIDHGYLVSYDLGEEFD